MKLLPATKVALKFAAVCALAYGGWRGYTAYHLSKIELTSIAPDSVNLIAVAPGPGFRIIVANQVAQLVETSGEFQSSGAGDESYDSGIKRRVPIREMLGALAGDPAALGRFLYVMTGQREDDLPPVRQVWKAEEVKRALDGDAALQAKLEKDLNVRLDGTPLTTFTLQAIENGIVLEVPITARVSSGGRGPITTSIQRPFRPSFAKSVSDKISESPADIGLDKVAAIYKQKYEEWKAEPDSRQDLRKDLLDALDTSKLQSAIEGPEKLLAQTQVILNSNHILSASYEKNQATGKGALFDLRLQLTSEGRDRLWKYSHDRTGFQLLFVVDGIAIAAPRITHEMWQSDILMSQLPDEVLVRDAVDTINKLARKGNSRS